MAGQCQSDPHGILSGNGRSAPLWAKSCLETSVQAENLPFVIPVSQEDLPQIEWETDYQFYEYYHGYEKLEKEGKKPAFHYGFGLSYTDFKIRDASFRLKDL